MFNTANKSTPFKMNLKRVTIANNSTAAFSSNYQTNHLKRQTNFQSKLGTTRQSIFNSQSNFLNSRSSLSRISNTSVDTRDKNQSIDTSQISTLISIDIRNDIRLSKGDLRTQFRTQTYILGLSKVVTEQSHPIPKIVLQAYRQAKQGKFDQNQRVSFCQGYLEKANIIYYSVQKQLFLFNGQELSKSNSQAINSLSCKKVTLKDILFKIYQVQLKTTLIQKKIQKKILLFSYPYQIEFCTYQSSPKSCQIKLIDLEFAYALNTKKGQFFQSTADGKIIYLDDDGKLNYISTQENKTLGIFGSGKYGLKNNTASRFLRNQFFAKQDGLWNKIKILFRRVTNYTTSLLTFKHQNWNLIYDEKREMIFTLAQYTRNQTFQVRKKTIKVFNITENDYIPIWSISEQQILENVNSKSFFTGKLTSSILNICKVDKNYIKGSNLLLILRNSTRVYLDITQEKVIVSQIIYPPQFSNLESFNRQKPQNNLSKFSEALQKDSDANIQKQLKIHQKQTNQSQIKSYYCKNNIFISIVLHEKFVYSLLYYKQSFQSQNQKIMNIQWKDKITNETQLPIQNYMYKISQSILMQAQNKNLLSNDNQICDAYQYLRQVFYPPHYYYYCNDLFVSKFLLLRPIDVLFSVIQHHTFYVCETLLPKLFNNVSLKQICVMLIQIYTNEEGVYYESSSFNQSIQNIIHKEFFIKNSRNSQTGYRIIEQQGKKKYVSKNIVKKVSYKQISRQTIGLIQKLFIQFSCHNFITTTNQLDYFFSKIQLKTSKTWQKNEIQRNKNLLKNQFGSIILYISRIYHPIWDKMIHKIDQQQNKSYIIKIKSLKKMNSLFKSNSTQQVIALKIDGFLQKSVQILNLISVIKNFPNISFQDCFQKDAKFFEQYIFKTIDSVYEANMLSKFQVLFPMYLNNYFKKIIKMYEQVRIMTSHSKIMDLLKQQSCFPRYFIDYLVNVRQINEARILRVQGQTRVITTKLRIPGNLTKQGQINYIFDEVKKSYRPINQKLYFLELAEQRIEQLAYNSKKSMNVSNLIIRQMRQTHEELLYCLKIQRMMKQQYQNQQCKPQHPKTSFFSSFLSRQQQQKHSYKSSNDQIATKLQNRTYTQQNIRNLLQKMNSPKLLIIFLTIFGQNRQFNEQLAIQWQFLIQNIKNKSSFLQNEEKNIQKLIKLVQEAVKDIIQITKEKLNLKIMLKQVSKLFYSSKNYMDNLKGRNSNQCFLFGNYLGELNCDPTQIMAYYMQVMEEETINHNRMNQMEAYFYIWFNCLQFVKRFCLQGISKFVACTEEYINLYNNRLQNQERGQKIQINIMKLELKKLRK